MSPKTNVRTPSHRDPTPKELAAPRRTSYPICMQCMSRVCDHVQGQVISLSARDRQIISAIARALSNQEIAVEIGVSVQMVKFDIYKLFQKLRLRSRLEIAVWGLSHRELWDEHTAT